MAKKKTSKAPKKAVVRVSKNATKSMQNFPNSLKWKGFMLVRGERHSIKGIRFLGNNGRFGLTDKLYGEFSFDEMCEFYIAHNLKTRTTFLTGIIPPNYVSPFDKAIELPVKPEKSTDGEAENVNEAE